MASRSWHDQLAREEAGAPAKGLAHAEIVEEDGARVFRFVKAIPTAQPCLNCHGGDDVKPEAVQQLAELYSVDPELTRNSDASP